ncbi:MAG: IS200/IS605 family transposase [Bacteroidetes bacterium]|nr:IS200/IS605 family transposase [Bacteroidota bacterium]
MSDTFSKIYIHCVFAVRGRENLIGPSIRDRVHSYISSGLKNEGVYPLAVGGWKDHVHVLFTLKPNQNISYIMQSVKSNSSKWINSNGLIKSKFHWQAGFGAFSCSEDGVDGLIKYIMNQEAHHSKKSFKEEF